LSLSDTIEARTYASIASLPFGIKLAELAGALVKKRSVGIDAGPVRVILPPRTTARIMGVLAAKLSPSAGHGGVLRGATVSSLLHLLDDGQVPGALRTRKFDDRGAPPIPLTLIKEGQVMGGMMDPEMARANATLPTGHCSEGKIGPTNLALRSGRRSINAISMDASQLMLMADYVDDFSGIDVVNNTITLPVHGRVMNRTEHIGSVINGTLSGDLLAVLNGVAELASDTDRIGHVDAPGIVVDGLTLTLN
jgi:PmbA protein